MRIRTSAERSTLDGVACRMQADYITKEVKDILSVGGKDVTEFCKYLAQPKQFAWSHPSPRALLHSLSAPAVVIWLPSAPPFTTLVPLIPAQGLFQGRGSRAQRLRWAVCAGVGGRGRADAAGIQHSSACNDTSCSCSARASLQRARTFSRTLLQHTLCVLSIPCVSSPAACLAGAVAVIGGCGAPRHRIASEPHPAEPAVHARRARGGV